MKKLIALVLALLLVVSAMAGCSTAQPQQPEDGSQQQEQEQQEQEQPQEPVFAEDGANAMALLPADSQSMQWVQSNLQLPEMLDPDLQELYRAAYWFYTVYKVSGLNDSLIYSDSISMPYGEIYINLYRDGNFADFAAYETAVRATFTPELAESFLTLDTIAEGENGGLYCTDGGMGSNIFYVGHSFELAESSADRVVVNCLAVYNETIPNSSLEGRDQSQDRTETNSIVFELTDSGWRVGEFFLPQYPHID